MEDRELQQGITEYRSSLPYFRSIFIFVFVVAEGATLIIDGIYLATGQSSLTSFFVDFAIFTFFTAALVLTSYFLIRRILFRLKESEETYRSIFNMSPDFIFLVRDGRVVEANPALLKRTGMTVEELGKYDLVDFSSDGPENLAAAFDTLRRGRDVIGLELWGAAPGGERYYYEIDATPVMEGGRLVGTVGLARDITEHRKWTDALSESEEKYRLLAENVTDVIWTRDMELNFTFLSPSVEKLRGFTVEEASAMNLAETVTAESLEKALAIWVDELEMESHPDADPNRYRTLELEEYRKDGSTVWTETRVSFLRDEEGRPVGVLGVSRDISERKKWEEEMKLVNAELKGYAQTVSHDLKAPLATSRAGAELLLRLYARRDRSEYLSRSDEVLRSILKGVDKASELASELLRLAEAGQVPRSVSDVDVSETVARILEEKSGVIENKHVTVKVDDDLGTVKANPVQVYQVFANLIGNAIVHNDSSEPLVSVRYLGDGPGGEHRYSVSDNGPGIPQASLDKVFLPFYKGRSGQTGIGLSIVDRIVKVYGGEISVESNGGARFEFSMRDYIEEEA